METKQQPYLTPEQVNQLNEKHGWFEFGDAQSDVSKAFAQDAIDMHERMRAAAPDMLAALLVAEESVGDLNALEVVRAAIAKATGSTA